MSGPPPACAACQLAGRGRLYRDRTDGRLLCVACLPRVPGPRHVLDRYNALVLRVRPAVPRAWHRVETTADRLACQAGDPLTADPVAVVDRVARMLRALARTGTLRAPSDLALVRAAARVVTAGMDPLEYREDPYRFDPYGPYVCPECHALGSEPHAQWCDEGHREDAAMFGEDRDDDDPDAEYEDRLFWEPDEEADADAY